MVDVISRDGGHSFASKSSNDAQLGEAAARTQCGAIQYVGDEMNIPLPVIHLFPRLTGRDHQISATKDARPRLTWLLTQHALVDVVLVLSSSLH